MINVLIADDHSIVRKGLRQLCKSMGDVIVAGEAANGEEVLEALQHAQFDLVLLDLTMPGVSGPEICAAMREIDPGAKLIIASGHVNGCDARGVVEHGAIGFLEKPFGMSAIANQVDRILRAKEE